MIRVDAALREVRGEIDPVDAQWLLAHVLGKSRSWLYAHGDEALGERDAGRFADLLARRRAGEPVAYLIGHRGFRDLELQVTPATLIPRPETELLVELALARLAPDCSSPVADLGTGSGAIALALAGQRAGARIVASDASEEALAVARRNAASLKLGNVEFRHGDWLVPLAGEAFDLIASNPPYIADDDPHLACGDLRFEPPGALASGADGLDAIRTITRDAPAHLVPGGWLLLEHGWQQGTAVRALLADAGLVEVETVRDIEQRDRVSLGRKPVGA